MRFEKMVTLVQDGPVPSGDGKAVEKHSLQDLRDIDEYAHREPMDAMRQWGEKVVSTLLRGRGVNV
jgi:hypothetical protein